LRVNEEDDRASEASSDSETSTLQLRAVRSHTPTVKTLGSSDDGGASSDENEVLIGGMFESLAQNFENYRCEVRQRRKALRQRVAQQPVLLHMTHDQLRARFPTTVPKPNPSAVRGASTAAVVAAQREYDEIVARIRLYEDRPVKGGSPRTPATRSVRVTLAALQK
jgi:hypothetical protein